MHLMSIMNKQDYARWHSYEFMLATKTFDPSLRPPGHPEVIPLLLGKQHWVLSTEWDTGSPGQV